MTAIKQTNRIGLLFGAALLIATTAAHAGTFEVDYTTMGMPGDSAKVLLTTTDTPSNGVYTVIGASGERDGVTIIGLSPYASADQLLSAAAPSFDFAGVSFATAGGDYNLFVSNGGYYEVASTVDLAGNVNSGVMFASFSVTEVPEPASMTLLGMGLTGMGVLGRRRRTAAAATAA